MFFFSIRRRQTSCAVVTGVQTVLFRSPRCSLFVGAASCSAFDYGPDQLPGARGMPASFFRFAPGWRTLGLAVALPVALAAFCPATFAADVLVVTDSRHPVKTMGGERLIELDEAHRIEAELSAELPADPEQAAPPVNIRLSAGGADLQTSQGRR